LGVCLFLSPFAVPRRFSLQPSCHLAVVPLSSFTFSLLSLPPLSRRSPLPRPATPPPPADPLLSRLLPPFGATLPSSRHILAPRVYRISSSPRARTTLLTPTPIICRQVISLLRSTLVSDTCTSTDDVGAGVPFGCIVTADDEITFRPPRVRLPRFPPVRLYVRYVQRGSRARKKERKQRLTRDGGGDRVPTCTSRLLEGRSGAQGGARSPAPEKGHVTRQARSEPVLANPRIKILFRQCAPVPCLV